MRESHQNPIEIIPLAGDFARDKIIPIGIILCESQMSVCRMYLLRLLGS